jgi:hypothetical protein
VHSVHKRGGTSSDASNGRIGGNASERKGARGDGESVSGAESWRGDGDMHVTSDDGSNGCAGGDASARKGVRGDGESVSGAESWLGIGDIHVASDDGSNGCAGGDGADGGGIEWQQGQWQQRRRRKYRDIGSEGTDGARAQWWQLRRRW